MLELALIENLQREHLNPIEIAISYKRLIDECRYTQEEVSQKIGKDRTTITNFLRLLKLPEPIQTAVRKGDISSGHARALVAIEDAGRQMEIFKKVLANSLSVRDVERLAREKKGGKPGRREAGRGSSAASSSLASVEEKLRRILGTRIRVSMQPDGKGEILIEYYSEDDLDRILELFSIIEDRER